MRVRNPLPPRAPGAAGATAAHTEAPFGALEWGLMAGLALTWGASFLFIAVGLEDFPPAAITLLRLVFGAGTLALLPAARKPLPRSAWRRLVPLAVLQMALPLMLFPLAQQHVDSSLAGMMNGTVPIFAALVAAVVARSVPPSHQRLGLGIGFAGVVAISWPTLDAPSSAYGVGLLTVAVLSYAVAINIAAPLQRAHGALPVTLRVALLSVLLVSPLGLPALPQSTPRLASVAALLVLGCAGTGLAFAALFTLVGRVGATRGSVAVYLTPAVAITLGVLVRGEHVVPVQLLGTALAVTGAWLTSRSRIR